MAAIRALRRRLGVARSRRRSGERGAVAVEAALITPLIVLLLFGIIEFGLVFKNYLAVTSSTRAGVRIAAAMPRDSNFAIRAAEAVVREGQALERTRIKKIWVYDANKTSGLPDSGNFNSCTKCVKYTVSAAGTPVYSGGAWAATSQNACLNDDAHTYLGVYVEYENPGVTGIIFSKLTLSDRSVMSLEPMSNTAVCK